MRPVLAYINRKLKRVGWSNIKHIENNCDDPANWLRIPMINKKNKNIIIHLKYHIYENNFHLDQSTLYYLLLFINIINLYLFVFIKQMLLLFLTIWRHHFNIFDNFPLINTFLKHYNFTKYTVYNRFIKYSKTSIII